MPRRGPPVNAMAHNLTPFVAWLRSYRAATFRFDFVVAVTVAVVVGMIQLGLGFARLGVPVNFVSHSVVIGVAAGAGMLIGVRVVRGADGSKSARRAYPILRPLLAKCLPEETMPLPEAPTDR